jgi:hypothetical protein
MMLNGGLQHENRLRGTPGDGEQLAERARAGGVRLVGGRRTARERDRLVEIVGSPGDQREEAQRFGDVLVARQRAAAELLRADKIAFNQAALSCRLV